MFLYLALLVVLVALALFLIGVIAHGLFYLLIIGIVVFAAEMVFLGLRRLGSGRRSGR
ncbi:hypothetical protein [Actinacidiphila sp. ITFR-21]|uniref:hypothetical protein n=1 Tax=Actinacidiphila sp. ITFR-21 TaxID=3075199 RepID=UPI00288AA0B0|nr:hypothetical protein [Streptomyces sp. ITFR-21]WNI15384.1 hypothetical protein RLT57_07465 [Streptomyces sp. ITFR-21]